MLKRNSEKTSSELNSQTLLSDFILRFIQDPSKKVLLLIGNADSGLFTYLSELPKHIPLKPIHLVPDKLWLTDSRNAISRGVKEHDINCELSELTNNTHAFIFNGYQRIKQWQNLFITNQLMRFTHAKLIISCEQKVVDSFKCPTIFFSPMFNEQCAIDQLQVVKYSNEYCLEISLNDKPFTIEDMAAYYDTESTDEQIAEQTISTDAPKQKIVDPVIAHMNQRNRSKQRDLVQFDADIVRKGDAHAEEHRSFLKQVYELSRNDKSLRNASAYAASVLSAAKHSFVGEDLSHLDLSGAVLDDSNFDRANFSHTQLIDASMQRCNLREANIEYADLSGAKLGLQFRQKGFYEATDLLLHHVDSFGTYMFTVMNNQINISIKLEVEEAFNLRRSLQLHKSKITWISLLRCDGTAYLVSADSSGLVLVWNIANWQPVAKHQFTQPMSLIQTKQLSDEKWLFTPDSQKVTVIGLTATPTINLTIDSIDLVSLKYDRAYLVTLGIKKYRLLIDKMDIKLSGPLELTIIDYHHSSDFGPHCCARNTLVLSDINGDLLIWRDPACDQPVIIHTNQGPLQVLEISEDGKYIFSAGKDGYLALWSVDARKCITRLQVTLSHSATISYFSTYHTLYVINRAGELLRWDLDQLIARKPDIAVLSAVMNNNRDHCIYFSDDHQLCTVKINGATLKVDKHSSLINFTVTALCEFKNDLVALGCEDGSVRLWNLISQKVVQTLTPPNDLLGHPNLRAITTLALTGHQHQLFAGSECGYIYIWDTECVDDIHFGARSEINCGAIASITIAEDGYEYFFSSNQGELVVAWFDDVADQVCGARWTYPHLRKVLFRDYDRTVFQIERQIVTISRYDRFRDRQNKLKPYWVIKHPGITDACLLGQHDLVTVGVDKSIIVWDNNYKAHISKTDEPLLNVMVIDSQHFLTISTSGVIQKWLINHDKILTCLATSELPYSHVRGLQYKNTIGLSAQDVQTLRVLQNNNSSWATHGIKQYERAFSYSSRLRRTVEQAIVANPEITLSELKKQCNFIFKMNKSVVYDFVEAGNLSAVKAFVEEMRDHTCPSRSGHSLLMLAARHGHFPIVDYLISKGADINYSTPENGVTALFVAASDQNERAVAELVVRGAKIDHVSPLGITAIIMCALNGLVNSLRLFHDVGADLHQVTGTGFTALNTAVEAEQIGCVEYLLKCGAPTEIRSWEAKATPLLYASTKNLGIVKLLVKYKAKIDATTSLGLNALMCAAQFGKVEIIEYLIELGLSLNDQIADGKYKGWTAAHFATLGSSLEVLNVLIMKGASIDIVAGQSITPLSIALYNGDSDIVLRLLKLDKTIKINANTMLCLPSKPVCSLAAVVWQLTDDAIISLCDAGFNLYWQDTLGNTILHYVAYHAADRNLAFLLKLGAKNLPDNNGITPANIMAGSNKRLMLESMLKFDPSLAMTKNHHGKTLLHYCAEMGVTSVLSILVQHKADLNARTNNGYTPLLYAIQYNHIDFVYELLKEKPDVNICPAEFPSALISAIRMSDPKLVSALIAAGADVNTASDVPPTTPILSASRRDFSIFKMVVEAGANVCACDDDNGYTPLHCAVLSSNESIVLYLVNKIAQLGVQQETLFKPNKKGYTPLMLASNRDSSVIFDIILAHTKGHVNDSFNGECALTIAIDDFKNDYVAKLLSAGADINKLDTQCRTPLMDAAKGNIAAVCALLKAGATTLINHQADQTTGRITALMIAASVGNCAIIEELIKYGADISIVGKYGNALCYAAEYGHLDAVKLLIKKEIAIQCQSEFGYTAADAAFSGGYHQVVEYLEGAGLKVNGIIRQTQELRKQAQEHYQNLEADKAIKCCLAICNLSDTDASCYQSLACLYAAQGDSHRAEEAYKKSIAINVPNQFIRPGLLCEYGMFLMKLNRYQEALQLLAHAAKLPEYELPDLEYGLIELTNLSHLPLLADMLESNGTLKVNSSMLARYCTIKILLKLSQKESAYPIMELFRQKAYQREKSLYIKMWADYLNDIGNHSEARKLLDNIAALTDDTTEQTQPQVTQSQQHATSLQNIDQPLLQEGNQNKTVQDNKTAASLMDAIQEKRLSEVIEFLSSGADINERDQDGRTCLMTAADCDDTEIVEILLLHDLQKNQISTLINCQDNHGMTSLFFGCRSGNLRVVDLLFKYGADCKIVNQFNQSALFFVGSHALSEMIGLFFEQDSTALTIADKKGTTILHKAAKNGWSDAVEILIGLCPQLVPMSTTNGHTALTLACLRGHKNVIDLLLPYSKSNDGKICTPFALQMLAYGGHLAILRYFYEKLSYDVEATDEPGSKITLLQYCAENNLYSAAQLLLQLGANPHTKHLYDNTLLHIGAYNGSCRVLWLLAQAGVDLNAVNENGSTPLHDSALNGKTESLITLLHCGAKSDVKNKDGKTALDFACEKQHERIQSHLTIANNPQGFFGQQIDLPTKVLLRIFQMLTRQDYNSLSLVNRAWCFALAIWVRNQKEALINTQQLNANKM